MSIAERAAYAEACALVRRFGNEIMPVGTTARLEKLEAVVEAADAVSNACTYVNPGPPTTIEEAAEFYHTTYELAEALEALKEDA